MWSPRASSFFFFFFYYWVSSSLTLPMVKPFPISPSQKPPFPTITYPSSLPLPPCICPSTQHSPTFPQLPHPHLFPFVVASIEPLPDQRPLLPLMPKKAFLCHIFGWNHVYSLVDDSVPGSLGVSGSPKSLFFPWGYIPLQLLQTMLQILRWGPQAQSKLGC